MEGNPLSFVDPEGLQFFDLTTVASLRRETTLDDAVRAGAWTRAVTMPAVTAGLTPSAIGLVGSSAIPACTTATRWYLTGAEADAAWLNLSLRDKLLYEIGQKTTASYARYSSLDPVSRGASIVADLGWARALTPEIGGVKLGIGSTFSTGPTPLFRWLLPRIAGGATVAAPLVGDSEKCGCQK